MFFTYLAYVFNGVYDITTESLTYVYVEGVGMNDFISRVTCTGSVFLMLLLLRFNKLGTRHCNCVDVMLSLVK